MSVKPILFSAEMVRAILDGRKTVTRRVVKPQPVGKLAYCMAGYKHGTWGYPSDDVWKYWGDAYKRDAPIPEREKSRHWTPPCRQGDVLWVRETFRVDYLSNIVGSGRVQYKADGSFGDIHFQPARYDMMRRAQLKPGWRPNENMPKEAARIFLRVTDVRVQRLQEIDEDGAIAEGCSAGRFETTGGPWGVEDNPDEWAAREDFSHVWDSTIKHADLDRYGWYANPWVWVIAFERCEKPEEA